MYSMKETLNRFIQNDNQLSRGELLAIFSAYSAEASFEDDLKEALLESDLSTEQIIALVLSDGNNLESVWNALDANDDKVVSLGETSDTPKVTRYSSGYQLPTGMLVTPPTTRPALSDVVADSPTDVINFSSIEELKPISTTDNNPSLALAKIMAFYLGRTVSAQDYQKMIDYLHDTYPFRDAMTGKQLWDAIRSASGDKNKLEKSDIEKIIGRTNELPEGAEGNGKILSRDESLGTDLKAGLFQTLDHTRFKITDLTNVGTEVGRKFASLIANIVGRDITAAEFQEVAERLETYFAGQPDITLRDVLLAFSEAGTDSSGSVDKADWEAIFSGTAKGPSEAYKNNPYTMKISPRETIPAFSTVANPLEVFSVDELQKAPTSANPRAKAFAELIASYLGRDITINEYFVVVNYMLDQLGAIKNITGDLLRQLLSASSEARNDRILEAKDFAAIIADTASPVIGGNEDEDDTAVTIPRDTSLGTDLKSGLFKTLDHNRFEKEDLADITTETGKKFASLIGNIVGRDITVEEFEKVNDRIARFYPGQSDITLRDILLAFSEVGTTTGNSVDKADLEAVFNGTAKWASEAYRNNPYTLQISPWNTVPDLGEIVEKQDLISLADLYKRPAENNPKAQKFAQFIATYLNRDITMNEYFTVMNYILDHFQSMQTITGSSFWQFLSTASGMSNIIETGDFSSILNGTAHKNTNYGSIVNYL